ncbi:MAG: hypothetical protein LBB91_03885, partial [Clostridiales bacterium]|nr:hypothetical protein [Clostridiales bacterium]
MKKIGGFDLKSTAVGFNNLLEDIYCEKRQISDLLLQCGLSNDNIDVLKTEKASEFYEHIQFAMGCHLLHYSGGYGLLLILYRRYGLFGYRSETLQEIGSSLGISYEQVQRLERKAIKQMRGSVPVDSMAITLALAACKVLKLDEMEIIRAYFSNNTDKDTAALDVNLKTYAQQVIVDLPKANFYIQGSFNYGTRRGYYQLLMEFGDHKKYFEEHDLEGSSDTCMVLLAVIDGLGRLKKPCAVTVYSNTLFGLQAIYKHGALREEISVKAANFELKDRIRLLLSKNG